MLINSIRGARRRDTGEEVSRILAAIAPLIGIWMFAPLALALTAAGAFGGWSILQSAESERVTLIVLRVVLLVVTFATLLGPLVRSTQGAELNPTRLALLPVRRRTLFGANLLGAMGEPWLIAVIPGLLVLPAVMALRGAVVAGTLALLASVLMILALSILGALCGFLVVLLFRDRRRAERFTVLAMLLIVIVSVLPAVFEEQLEAIDDDAAVARWVRSQDGSFVWARWLPSELYAFAVEGALRGEPGPAAGHLLGLALLGALLGWVAFRANLRVLDAPGGSGPRAGGSGAEIRWPRLPFLDPATSSVAWIHARGSLRTVRGKLAVLFNFVFVALIAFTVQRHLATLGSAREVSAGPLFYVAGFVFTLLSLQPIAVNTFAVDRAGLTLLLISPLTASQIVRGKIAGGGLLTAISCALCFVTALALAPRGSPLLWGAAIIATLGSYVLFGALACWLSAWLPKTSDLSRLGKAGNPHPIASLLGVVLGVLIGAPAALLLLPAVFVDIGGWLPLLLSLLWLALGLVLGRGAERASVAFFESRCENLQLVAAGK